MSLESSVTPDPARDAAVAWLYGRINYERSAPIPYSEQGMKLDRMRELLRRVGDPQDDLPIVHVAGTKGKGSTAAMIAAALRLAGRRVGVYSSPHLDRIEERFAVDGAPCSAGDLVALVESLRPIAETMDVDGAGPTFFDLTTAAALLHFQRAASDAVVLEVGLGGRLDSTNVVTPLAAVVTSISLDHTRQLGETLPEIAAEKAGIFKPGVPAVIGVPPGEAGDVLARTARERACPTRQRGVGFEIERTGRSWRYAGWDDRSIDDVEPALPGAAYADNAATALATLQTLSEAGWRIAADECRRGVGEARLPARMERFAGEPLVVIDGAHNDASAAALANALDELCPGASVDDRVLLIAISEEKDAGAILGALTPRFGRVVTTRYVDNPRAMTPERLAAMCTAATPIGDPVEAYRVAREMAGPAGAVVVTGSLFLAAELRRVVLRETAEK